jgi:hypothetical protein
MSPAHLSLLDLHPADLTLLTSTLFTSPLLTKVQPSLVFPVLATPKETWHILASSHGHVTLASSYGHATINVFLLVNFLKAFMFFIIKIIKYQKCKY